MQFIYLAILFNGNQQLQNCVFFSPTLAKYWQSFTRICIGNAASVNNWTLLKLTWVKSLFFLITFQFLVCQWFTIWLDVFLFDCNYWFYRKNLAELTSLRSSKELCKSLHSKYAWSEMLPGSILMAFTCPASHGRFVFCHSCAQTCTSTKQRYW